MYLKKQKKEMHLAVHHLFSVNIISHFRTKNKTCTYLFTAYNVNWTWETACLYGLGVKLVGAVCDRPRANAVRPNGVRLTLNRGRGGAAAPSVFRLRRNPPLPEGEAFAGRDELLFGQNYCKTDQKQVLWRGIARGRMRAEMGKAVHTPPHNEK